MSLHTQLIALGAMILGGMYVGFTNDTFRRFQPLWRGSAFFNYSLEVLFWLIQTYILYTVLYRINYGELRLYLFIALFVGFLLYHILFRTIYQKILDWIIQLGRQFLFILYQSLALPIILIIKLLWRMVLFVILSLTKIIQFLVASIIQPIIKLLIPKKTYQFISKKGELYSTMIHNLLKRMIMYAKKWRR